MTDPRDMQRALRVDDFISVAANVGAFFFVLGPCAVIAAASFMSRTRQRRFPLGWCVMVAVGPTAVAFGVPWLFDQDIRLGVLVVLWVAAGVATGYAEPWLGKLFAVGPRPRVAQDAASDMPTLRVKMCSLAEQVAAALDVKLDYSERSIQDVDRILGQVHDEYRRTGNDEGIQGIALEFAAYLVSVLEKHRGPVLWERDHPELGADTYPVEWRGATLFPFGWCLKRLLDGPDDDLVSKWQTLVVSRDKPSAT
ncbi:MAG: hypothetical protein ACRC8S_08015 [Fimbriiglobus sp.]